MSVCFNYRDRHVCLGTWTIALACIFVLGALAFGLSMRTVPAPTTSELTKVSEMPIEAGPVTPEVAVPEAAPAAPAVEEKGLEMEVSQPVVVSQPEAVAVEENPYPENPDIGGQGG